MEWLQFRPMNDRGIRPQSENGESAVASAGFPDRTGRCQLPFIADASTKRGRSEVTTVTDPSFRAR